MNPKMHFNSCCLTLSMTLNVTLLLAQERVLQLRSHDNHKTNLYTYLFHFNPFVNFHCKALTTLNLLISQLIMLPVVQTKNQNEKKKNVAEKRKNKENVKIRFSKPHLNFKANKVIILDLKF